MTNVDDGFDGLDVVREGKTAWTWHWRSPWSTTVVSPTSYKSKAAALSAGRQWVREHR